MSEVFTTEMSGHCTVMLAVEELSPWLADASLAAAPSAVLVTVPQVAAVVGEEMCTVLLAPGAISPKEQVSTPPLMEQSALSWLHTTPAGRVSVRVTLLATPAPLFVTNML